MAVLLSLFQTRDWKKPNFYPWSSVDTMRFPKCKFFTGSENLWEHIMRTPFLASKGLLAKYLKLNKPRPQLASSLFDAASQLGFHTVFTRWCATIYSRTRFRLTSIWQLRTQTALYTLKTGQSRARKACFHYTFWYFVTISYYKLNCTRPGFGLMVTCNVRNLENNGQYSGQRAGARGVGL